MRRYSLLVVWLLLVWLLLFGELSVANLLGGLVVVAVLLVVFPIGPVEGPIGRVRPLRWVGFALFFVWELVKATATVAWEIVTPGSRIRQGVIEIEVLGASDALVTLVANVITLTPGTLTLEVRKEPCRLYVHTLHLRDLESVRRDVLHLEAFAIRAFGSAEAIRLLEAAEAAREQT